MYLDSADFVHILLFNADSFILTSKIFITTTLTESCCICWKV